MTATLADYSTPPTNPAALKAAGIAGVLRYLDGPNALGRLEADNLAGAGLLIGSIYERGAADADQPGLGQPYGSAAKTAALGAGQPVWAPIYFAVDFDLQTGQVAGFLGFLKAAGEACAPYPAGVYGGFLACAAAAYTGCRWLWQTVAWSGGKVQAGIGILQTGQSEQVGGTTVDVDLDEGVLAAHGLWTPGAAPSPPPPTFGPGWELAYGFAPPPPGMTAYPIIVQGKVIGEHFA